MSVRVLVLALSVDREPWRSIERDGQRATWAAPSDVDALAPVRFYRGRLGGPIRFSVAATLRILVLAGSGRRGSMAWRVRAVFLRLLGRHHRRSAAATEGDIVHVAVPETYSTVASKSFVALRHVLATERFDYLLRTNTSTYVDRRRLLETAESLPRSGYWGGCPFEHDANVHITGSGILMSRDVVERAVAEDWDWASIDDVALAEVLRRHGITPRPLPRPTIPGPGHVDSADLDAFMWRCKGDTDRDDAATMRALHLRLQRER